MRKLFASSFMLHLLASLFLSPLAAQVGATSPRVTQAVDDSRRTVLEGNTHPLARPKYDIGLTPDGTPADRMLLVLTRTPAQQSALTKLLDDQQNPGSAMYHKWLTPAEFGERFGPAASDVTAVSSWLEKQGFKVNRISSSKNVIEFSGTTGQVRKAFRTEMHKYAIRGEERIANASDPQVPAALAPVVKGLVSLNNFPRKASARNRGSFTRDLQSGGIRPNFTFSDQSGSTFYAIGAGDFAKIYNTKPQLLAGTNGAGQTIAIIGRTTINLNDVMNFRNLFGLGVGNNKIVIDGENPGRDPDDEFESAMDMEWANAAAPGAAVTLVSAANTITTSGLDIAALHVVENNMASVMSISYGICESALGSAGTQFLSDLFAQAAAQGITVTVSTGDNGSAGCDDPFNDYIASKGTGVNAIASTPYNVAVGGTDFDYGASVSSYWSTSSNPTDQTSALSYIPEKSWNGSCGSTATISNTNVCPTVPSSGTVPDSLNLLAGSGGASVIFNKPIWQVGTGVPNDGKRDIPDVSLFSAITPDSHTFYIGCLADHMDYYPCQISSSGYSFYGASGTSIAAPSFAGIMAMAAQKAGTRLGNVNPLLYSLAAKSGASCISGTSTAASCLFYDTVKGNNTVPCAAGSPNCSLKSGTGTGVIVDANGRPAFSTTTGYDLATGLGSVDGTNLVNAIASAVKSKPTTTTLALNGATTGITAQHGDAINIAVAVNPSTATGQVSVVGSKAGIDAATLSSGAANWASMLFPGGSYSVQAHYAGDGTNGPSDSNAVPITITPENSSPILNIITPTEGGGILFGAKTVEYGTPYILRVDVAEPNATTSATGINSRCSNGVATCPTGSVVLQDNGLKLDRGDYALNSLGFVEDYDIQLTGGPHSVSAYYWGDASYSSSSKAISVNVTKTSTSATVSTSQITPLEYGSYGNTIYTKITTNSSGVAPTGSITYKDNGADANASMREIFHGGSNASSTSFASMLVSSTYYAPSVGTHNLIANYSGDENYTASVSPAFTVSVDRATTRMLIDNVVPKITNLTLPVAISAYISSDSRLDPPTGAVTFYDNGNPIPGTVDYSRSSGSISASLQTTFATAGDHAISLTYAGDDKYKPLTTSLLTLKAYNKIPITISAAVGQSLALKDYPTTLGVEIGSWDFTGLPTPTGTVTFFDNGQAISTPTIYSRTGSWLGASVAYSFPTSGTHSVTAQYSGDSVFAASTTTNATSITVVDKLKTVMEGRLSTGGKINKTSTIYVGITNSGYDVPPITGTVTLSSSGGDVFSGPVESSSSKGAMAAYISHIFTKPGTFTITAQYSGDAHYEASSKSFRIDIYGPIGVSVYPSEATMPVTGGIFSTYLSAFNDTPSDISLTLACKPDSSFATCSIDPAVVNVPANGYGGANITITVPAASAATRQRPWALGPVFAIAMLGVCIRGRRRLALLLAVAMAAIALSWTACGGGGGGGTTFTGGSSGGGTTARPSVYNFTITATSGATVDTRLLTLRLQ